MLKVLFVAVAACGLFASARTAHAQRLPGGVRPEHYSLTITPNLQAATFRGVETIDVMLDAATSSITLNSAEIEFSSVTAVAGPGANTGVFRSAQDDKSRRLDDKRGGIDDKSRGINGKRREPDERSGAANDAAVTLDAVKEQATLTFARTLVAGPVTLKIEYAGHLNDKLRGFYLSKTKARSYAVTQFEATDARRAFPSFDEPALKATFEVTLVVDAGDTAISNTKIVSDKPGPIAGKHTIVFAPTPKMSTYLVAWLVGDFVCSKGKADGVPIRACSTPDKAALTKFAVETAKWTLHYYDRYFGIKYPMAKLDMVAIPDFEAGAMENFGCITYRETEMLVDEKDGPIAAKKEVAATIAHEMAHQWFGDMVTPLWWDNLWLNEGFATWMESKAAAKWHPEWLYDQSVAADLEDTLDLDSQAITRPIRANAETPAQINEMFDGIAYGKAGAVIGMIENWVGEDVFRNGVREYLAAHLYGNASADDFWSTQTRVSGLPVDAVMRGFIDMPGVPLVSFGEPRDGRVPVRQSRFFSRVFASPGADSAPSADQVSLSELWTVPVCLRSGGCPLVAPGLRAITAPAASPLFYANAGDKGYFRSDYAPAQLASIVASAESALTPPERIGLLGDRWALMHGGQGAAGEFLDLALAVRSDASATVVDSALSKIESIGKTIASDADRARLDAVVRHEFGPVYAALGMPQKHEPWDRAQLRSTLFEALGNAGDEAVMARARRVTADLLAGRKASRDSGDLAVADASVALASATGDAAMYDKLLRVARNSADPDLKTEALHLLTRFQDPLLVIRTLEYAISAEVRNQDSWTLIALLLSHRETQDLAWSYVQQHWAAISGKSTANSGARIVEATGGFCSALRRDEVVTFFAQHLVPSAERALAKSVDGINECIQLRAAQEPSLRRWLDAHPAP